MCVNGAPDVVVEKRSPSKHRDPTFLEYRCHGFLGMVVAGAGSGVVHYGADRFEVLQRRHHPTDRFQGGPHLWKIEDEQHADQ